MNVAQQKLQYTVESLRSIYKGLPMGSSVSIHIEDCEKSEIEQIAEEEKLHVFPPDRITPRFFVVVKPKDMPGVRIFLQTCELKAVTQYFEA